MLLLDVQLKDHCMSYNEKLDPKKKKDKKNVRSVSKLILPASRVRIAILEAIGAKVCNGTKKTYQTGYPDFRPILRINHNNSDPEAHTENIFTYEFAAAVGRFRNVMNHKDFVEAYKLFKNLGFKDKDRPNFVVHMFK